MGDCGFPSRDSPQPWLKAGWGEEDWGEAGQCPLPNSLVS